MKTATKLLMQSMLGGGQGDLLSLFANGENGFLFDNMSDLTRLFTTSTGPTQVAANDDPVGLMLDSSKWGGRTLAQLLAQSTNLAPAFVLGGAGWNLVGTDGTHIGTFANGSFRYQGDTTTPVLAITSAVNILTIGKSYEVTIPCIAWVSGMIKSDSFVGNPVIAAGLGTVVLKLVASAGAFDIKRQGTNVDLTIGDITVKELPGNHALQAGSTLRPLWKENSGKPYLKPDGGDDVLIAPFIPTPSLTMAVGVQYPAGAASDTIVMGGGASTGDKRAYIGISATSGTGKVTVGWGNETIGFISNFGPDLRGTDHVIVLTGDVTTREVWVDGVLVHTRAAASGPDGTGGGIALGAYNNAGSQTSFSAARIYAALAMNRRATPAEIARITSQFQQRF